MSDYYQFDLFLSFAKEDEMYVNTLWNTLQSNGLKVFFANNTLKEDIGRSFIAPLQNGLANSEHFLLYCTDYSMKSKWVREEYETFFSQFYLTSNKKRRLILYHDVNFDRETIPALLKNLQTSTSLVEIIFSLGVIEKLKKENDELRNEIRKIKYQNISPERYHIPPLGERRKKYYSLMMRK